MSQNAEPQLIEPVLHQLGPLLAQALVYNVGGMAARSELDKISDPLKKLVLQVRSKNWLDSALRSDSFPSDKVTEKEKNTFLQKVIRYDFFSSIHPYYEHWLTITKPSWSEGNKSSRQGILVGMSRLKFCLRFIEIATLPQNLEDFWG